MIKFFLLIIPASIMSYYFRICPIIEMMNIIISIYTESDEMDEYIWRFYLSIIIIFILMTCILMVKIILSFFFSFSLLMSKENSKFKWYELLNDIWGI
jgi:hypothetical protein